MRSLQGFSDAATPVFADFGKAAPVADRGDPGADPVLRRLDRLAQVARREPARSPGRSSAPPTRSSARPATSPAAAPARPPTWPSSSSAPKKTGGFDGLVDLIYNTTATINEFDQYGHFTRDAGHALTNCLDYERQPVGAGQLGLRRPSFNGPDAAASTLGA